MENLFAIGDKSQQVLARHIELSGFGQQRVALHLLMLFGLRELEQQLQRARRVAVQVRFRRAQDNVDWLVGACKICI